MWNTDGLNNNSENKSNIEMQFWKKNNYNTYKIEVWNI
jgi:hypothetical protein